MLQVISIETNHRKRESWSRQYKRRSEHMFVALYWYLTPFDTQFQRKWNEKCAARFDRQVESEVLTIWTCFWWIRSLPWWLRSNFGTGGSKGGGNSCEVARNRHGLERMQMMTAYEAIAGNYIELSPANSNQSNFILYSSDCEIPHFSSHWQVQRPSQGNKSSWDRCGASEVSLSS